MKKYPKIKRLGSEGTQGIVHTGKLSITEKMDGSNFRVKRHGDKLLFGSRNVVFKEHGDPMPLNQIGGQFEDVAKYLNEKIDIDKLKELEEEYGGMTLFGENMKKHTIEYNWKEVPSILGFDVWIEDNEKWLEPKEAKKIFNKLGLNFVPILDTVPVSDFDPEMEIPESKYRDGKAEGIVIKNINNGIWAKKRTEEFKEKMKQGKSKDSNNDTIDLINEYCPNYRIEKMINKLTKEEDKDLSMDLMNELPMRIVEDIFEEEYKDLVRSNKIINFKEFRSKIAKRCVAQLRDKMIKEVK